MKRVPGQGESVSAPASWNDLKQYGAGDRHNRTHHPAWISEQTRCHARGGADNQTNKDGKQYSRHVHEHVEVPSQFGSRGLPTSPSPQHSDCVREDLTKSLRAARTRPPTPCVTRSASRPVWPPSPAPTRGRRVFLRSSRYQFRRCGVLAAMAKGAQAARHRVRQQLASKTAPQMGPLAPAQVGSRTQAPQAPWRG